MGLPAYACSRLCASDAYRSHEDFLCFVATLAAIFAIIRLLDLLDRLTLAAAHHRSSFICRTTGRACALVIERARTRILRCCNDDPANAPSSDGGPATST